MTEIRFGIIGTGGMSQTMCRAMQSAAGVTPVAVLSGNAERAGAFASRFGLDLGTDRLEALLDPGTCDAVYVANRNADHADLLKAAIDAKRPAFVEKPLTISASQTDDLITSALRADVLVMENFWVLSLPAYLSLKADLAAAEGPKSLRFDFSMPAARSQLPGLFEGPGRGVLLDRAVYGFAYALDLFGPVAVLNATVRRDDTGLDLAAQVLLEHENGHTSTITVALDQAGPNTLSLSAAETSWTMSPSLAGERVTQKAFPRFDGPKPDWVSEGRAARLKQSGLLRRLKSWASASAGDFRPYGANPYHPVLAAFRAEFETPSPQSRQARAELSRSVSLLLEEVAAF